MVRVLSSLRTTLALVGLLVSLSAWGSFAIQARPEDYAAIEAGILLDWLSAEGLARPGASWWIVAMVATASLLCANTLVCVGVRLARAWRHKTLSARSASAHLAHMGFLLVLAAHLMGSIAGFRSDNHGAYRGDRFSVPARPTWSIDIGKVEMTLAPQGYPTSLDAEISIREGSRAVARGVARVNHPVMAEGVAIYLKNAETTLRAWAIQAPGLPLTWAEIGKPLTWNAGTLLLADWSRNEQGIALLVRWAPRDGAPRQGWVPVSPGSTLQLPDGPMVTWGELAVDTRGTFDVRYDPGASLALVGGVVLSASLLPLLVPRRRSGRAPEAE